MSYETSRWYPSRRKKRMTKRELYLAERERVNADLRATLAAEAQARREAVVERITADPIPVDGKRERRLAERQQFVSTGELS